MEFFLGITKRAYSSVAERIHGMDQAGFRLPLGPLLRSLRSFEVQSTNKIKRSSVIRSFSEEGLK